MLSTLGRCGSKYFIKNLDKNNIQMVARWNHWYPNKLIRVAKNRGGIKRPEKLNVIFLFADPIEIVLSVKQRELDRSLKWVHKHFKHLNSDPNDYKDIYKKDALNLERMFDAFYKRQKFNLLTLRYESMNENLDVISEFVGKKVELINPYVKRKLRFPDLSELDKKDLRSTYKSLRKKIINAEDCKVWSKCAS